MEPRELVVVVQVPEVQVPEVQVPLSINQFNKSVLCVMGEDTYQL